MQMRVSMVAAVFKKPLLLRSIGDNVTKRSSGGSSNSQFLKEKKSSAASSGQLMNLV
jgi:hypothetical protein